MSVKTQIDRLRAAKVALVSAIAAKGVEVPSSIKLDALPPYVGQIAEADYNFVFILSDGTRVTGEEIENMETPIGEVVQIQNGSGEVMWEYTPPAYDAILNNNSWDLISKASSSGVASTLWSVGDRKAIHINGTIGTLSVNATYYAYIVGFNHNGANNTIDFGTFKTAASGGVDVCLTDTNYEKTSTNGTKYFNMNHSTSANAGGWKSSNLRYDILGSTNTAGGDAGATTATSPVVNTLMSALPYDLRVVMRPITVYTDNVGTSTAAGNVTATIDYLPLMSEFEVHGTRSNANPSEKNYQAQYGYYAAGNSKMKYKHSATSANSHWWTRSPYATSGMFCVVSLWGMAHAVTAHTSVGLAPIFRV